MHGQTVCRHGTMHYTVHVSSAERLRAYGGHRGPWELYMGPSDTVQRVLWTVPWGGSFGSSIWVPGGSKWGHLGGPNGSFGVIWGLQGPRLGDILSYPGVLWDMSERGVPIRSWIPATRVKT